MFFRDLGMSSNYLQLQPKHRRLHSYCHDNLKSDDSVTFTTGNGLIWNCLFLKKCQCLRLPVSTSSVEVSTDERRVTNRTCCMCLVYGLMQTATAASRCLDCVSMWFLHWLPSPLAGRGGLVSRWRCESWNVTWDGPRRWSDQTSVATSTWSAGRRGY
jgi:hypothetical protein